MAETKSKKKEWKAFRTLRDTTIPKALFYIGETANHDPIYETSGISYPAGSIVLEEDITPPMRERIANGDLDTLIEEVNRKDALAEINVIERGTFAPEHSVEAIALANAGHRVLDREQIIELRSLGSDDAADAQQAALADGAGDRPNLPGLPDSSVSTEEAVDRKVQVTPSGVVATNVFAKSGSKKKK